MFSSAYCLWLDSIESLAPPAIGQAATSPTSVLSGWHTLLRAGAFQLRKNTDKNTVLKQLKN